MEHSNQEYFGDPEETADRIILLMQPAGEFYGRECVYFTVANPPKKINTGSRIQDIQDSVHLMQTSSSKQHYPKIL